MSKVPSDNGKTRKKEPIYLPMGSNKQRRTQGTDKDNAPRIRSPDSYLNQIPLGCFERGRIRVDDVTIQKHHKDLDFSAVRRIHDSFPFTGGGSFQPIGIRRATETRDGKKVDFNVLVFGAKRLQAQKDAGLKYIDCVYLTGSDTDAELLRVGENFLRTKSTVLEEAEQLCKFHDLVRAKLSLSGQLDQKGKGIGRPKGGLSETARRFDWLGGSVHSRRKKLQRAKAIANICGSAKEIAKASGLDNNQAALEWIAEGTGPMAQARRAEMSAEKLALLWSSRSKNGTWAAKGANAIGHEHKAAPVEGDGPPDMKTGSTETDDDPEDGDDDDDQGEGGAVPPFVATTQEALEKFWKQEGWGLWRNAPQNVRLWFIDMLRKAKCRAPMDIDPFIDEVFFGRKLIDCRILEAFAKSKGFSWKAVTARLSARGYKKKRESRANGPHSYGNIDRDYHAYPRVYSDKELNGPRESELAEVEEIVARRELAQQLTAYYDDLDDGDRSKSAAAFIEEIGND